MAESFTYNLYRFGNFQEKPTCIVFKVLRQNVEVSLKNPKTMNLGLRNRFQYNKNICDIHIKQSENLKKHEFALISHFRIP